MKVNIAEKVNDKERGLYSALLFPITFAFLVTFGVSRVISHLAPQLYLQPSPGLHIHHFTYGFFVLAFSGYMALVHNGPRGTYLIALLHGFGLGLALDEFGMWLHLRDDDITRWSYDGFFLAVGFVLFVITLPRGWRLLKRLWPFKKANKSQKLDQMGSISEALDQVDF